jgi:ribose-phosphate pyrophosphokinase
MNGDVKLFAGTANIPLATKIASKLGVRLEPITIKRFSDGETFVELEQNVRGTKAFIIQPTCAPTNDNLMELMLIIDALRRSSAAEIYAVIPYFGYARQDRRPGYSRVPISARVAATMLEGVGADHVITVDLHATQIQGFFHIPVDNIAASNLFVTDIYHRWMDENPIIVSPDVGGVARARHVAKHLKDMDLAIVDKRRPKANVSEVMNIIGDVTDRTCIIIDDMVDTAGTLAKAATALIEVGGARRCVAYSSHGVLSGAAYDNIRNSMLTELVVTDTIPLRENANGKVRQITIANVLADTITRVSSGGSVRELLD